MAIKRYYTRVKYMHHCTNKVPSEGKTEYSTVLELYHFASYCENSPMFLKLFYEHFVGNQMCKIFFEFNSVGFLMKNIYTCLFFEDNVFI